MSYRIYEQHKKKHKHRGVAAMSSLSTIDIVNGQYAKLAYPCWYIEQHVPKRLNPQPPQSREELIKLWERCIYWDKEHRWCCHPRWNSCGHKHCVDCKHYIDMSKVIPIHLREEYPDDKQHTPPQYTLSGHINFEHNSDGSLVLPGLEAEVKIDEYPNDYIVRMLLSANCPSAEDEMQQSKFSLVLQYNHENDKMKSVLVNGKIRVWPGIIEGVTYD